MNNTFSEFAKQFGTTDKLVRGKPEYNGRTIEEMRSDVLIRAKIALSAVKSNEVATKKSAMVRKVRNGLAIKIGYGAKNETLLVFGKDARGNDVVERRFFDEQKDDAIAFLEGAIGLIENGDLDEALDAKLDSFRLRAEKGKLARRKAKVTKTGGAGYISEVA